MVIGYVKFRAPEFESILGINDVAAGLMGLRVSIKGEGLGVRAAGAGATLASGGTAVVGVSLVGVAGAVGSLGVEIGDAVGVDGTGAASWAKTGAKGVNIINKANAIAVSFIKRKRSNTLISRCIYTKVKHYLIITGTNKYSKS